MPMNKRFQDKVAIVTGATSGIGRATALMLSREGANVVFTYNKNKVDAEKVAEDIGKSGGKFLSLKVDISKEDDVNQMVQKTIDTFGRVDIIVNNAAFLGMHLKGLQDSILEKWKHEIDTTFIGTILCCKAVMPHMINQKSGRIINVTSDAGKRGDASTPIYSACKAGIAGFSKSIAKELATHGITVNCVAPGLIKTETMALGMANNPALFKQWTAEVPMQRYGEPDDIASIILFLASDEAKYITGQEYSVDGGLYM